MKKQRRVKHGKTDKIGGGIEASHRANFRAFTLAEVLITLAIIGVVSALTLPTLIKNCQKVILVNQFKKNIC